MSSEEESVAKKKEENRDVLSVFQPCACRALAENLVGRTTWDAKFRAAFQAVDASGLAESVMPSWLGMQPRRASSATMTRHFLDL